MSAKANGKKAKIKSISVKKRSVALSLDNGEKISLSHDSFSEFNLYRGKELDSLQLKQVRDYASVDEFYTYGLRTLSKEPHSEHEVRERLKRKGAETEAIRKVIFRLKKKGLVDDELYAKTFADEVSSLRLYGKNRIIYTLKNKGISEDILDKLDFPNDDELEKAIKYSKIANAKLSKEPSLKKERKMISSLIDRGFDLDIAKKAVSKSFTPNNKKDELQRLGKAFDLALARYQRKVDGPRLKQKIFNYLLSKGYQYDDVKDIMEEHSL